MSDINSIAGKMAGVVRCRERGLLETRTGYMQRLRRGGENATCTLETGREMVHNQRQILLFQEVRDISLNNTRKNIDQEENIGRSYCKGKARNVKGTEKRGGWGPPGKKKSNSPLKSRD